MPLHNIVPRYARRTYNHKIFWSNHSHKTADQYNSACVILKNPCVKRWLEFRGYPSFGYFYETCYGPVTIEPDPDRVWVLMCGKDPFATFTNLGEAWLVLLGIEKFEEDYDWKIIYIDRHCE